jgi:hypothetical protein
LQDVVGGVRDGEDLAISQEVLVTDQAGGQFLKKMSKPLSEDLETNI